jgi:kinetochore protein Nuf2
MTAVGVPEFSMDEVFQPTAKHTIRNMSALINYARFREERLDIAEELKQESEDLDAQRQDLQDENEQLQKRLAELRADKEELVPLKEEIVADCDALTTDVTKLNKRQATLGNEIKELKAESNQYMDRIATDIMRTHEAKQETEKLRTQIVQSPEKIKKQLADMKTAVNGERSNVAGQESQLKDVRGRLDRVQKLNKDMKKNLAVVDELEAQAEKAKNAKAVLKETSTNIESNEDERRTLRNEEQTLRRQLDATKEKMKRVKAEGEQALKRAQMQLTKSQQEKVGLETGKAQNQAQIAQNEEMYNEMRENLDRLQRDHDADVDGMQALCGRLQAQVNSYHESLERRMVAPALR